MSAPTMSQETEPRAVGDHPASVESGNVPVAPITSEDRGLLDVLRDLGATV
jgi:hypothetical protein